MNAVSPRPKKTAFRAPSRRIVVFAASAGGLDVLRQVLGALPADFPAAIAVVLHRSPTRKLSVDPLVSILRQWTPLRVEEAVPGTTPMPGTVYVAPPSFHLVITAGKRFGFAGGTKVRSVHSSANPLLETAATAFGPDAIGVVLSGGDRDGTDGVQSIAGAGGTVLVQDPACCVKPDMPASAIATGTVTYVLPIEEIAGELQRLASEPKR